jgi:hypothetical protein
VNARSRAKTLQRRVRRGTKTKSKQARVAPNPDAAPFLGEKMRGNRNTGVLEDCSPSAAGEIVTLVVAGPLPPSVTDAGLNTQTAPEGSPPPQANVIVEWNPPLGVAVNVIGFDALPGRALVEADEGERVKAPAASTMVSVTGAETLA